MNRNEGEIQFTEKLYTDISQTISVTNTNISDFPSTNNSTSKISATLERPYKSAIITPNKYKFSPKSRNPKPQNDKPIPNSIQLKIREFCKISKTNLT